MTFPWYVRQELLHHGESKMLWLCCKWNILLKQCGTARYTSLFSCIRWMSTKIVRLDWKTLTLLTWRYNIKLHDLNKRKKYFLVLSRPDFWVVWRCYVILCFHLNFFVYIQTTSVNVMKVTTTLTDVVFIQNTFGWKQRRSTL